VADNGIGIAPEYAERVFGFGDRLHTDDIPGTGMGLAVCRTVVERHGGRIWVEPAPGGGSAFRFTLPAVRR
jgi:signal transduction histidine kinase